MGIIETIGNFVEDTVKKMVDDSNSVKVDVNVSTKNVIIQVQADKSDLGKIIGKKGRNIDSLNIITSAIKNTKFPEDKRSISIEIIEDEDSNFNRKD